MFVHYRMMTCLDIPTGSRLAHVCCGYMYTDALLPIGRCRRDEKLVKVDRPRRPWAPDKRVEWPVRRP